VIKMIDEWKPDLVVLGCHGRSALGRFMLGSVSQKVVTEARCSVRVVHDHVTHDSAPIRLVVGVDGSADADAAVQAVAEREWSAGSEVRVIVVIDEAMATAAEWTDADDAGAHARVDQLVEAAAEKLRVTGLVVSSLVKEGDPKRVLVEEAEAWGADCIFVGARGLRRLERFLLGSVSTAVAARAHCTVEVVHPRPMS
jgi:nucleotide-binding universal stress UspA family protein